MDIIEILVQAHPWHTKERLLEEAKELANEEDCIVKFRYDWVDYTVYASGAIRTKPVEDD